MRNLSLSISLIIFTSVFIQLLAMSANPIYYTKNNKYHIVQSGDTLTRISQEYNIPINQIRLFNNLTSDTIIVGQKIYLTPIKFEKEEYITVRSVPDTGYHDVRKGDTLSRLSKMYNISIIEIIDNNQLSSFSLREGDRIYLSFREPEDISDLSAADLKSEKSDKPSGVIQPEKESNSVISQKPRREKISVSKASDTSLYCPVKGTITSNFGNRNGTMHKGVDISAPMGTAIHAVQRGTVVFSGRQRGYGNVIILEHDDYVMTVYAHNESNLVRLGDTVDKGQPIATLGNSGTSTGPHLHFEYRVQGKAIDPVQVLTCLK